MLLRQWKTREKRGFHEVGEGEKVVRLDLGSMLPICKMTLHRFSKYLLPVRFGMHVGNVGDWIINKYLMMLALSMISNGPRRLFPSGGFETLPHTSQTSSSLVIT